MNRLLWTALLSLSMLAFVVAILHDRHSAAPSLSGDGPTPLVSGLNSAIGAFRSDLERLQVVDDCKLLLHPVDAPAVVLNMLSMRLRRDSDPDSGELELYLGRKEGRREWLLLSTLSWPAWAAAYSDVSQLRARCAFGDGDRAG